MNITNQDSSYRKVVQWALFISLLICFLKTARIPDPYAKAHYLFSYEHGLIKRGLIGTILKFFWSNSTPQSKQNIIFFISLAVVLIFLLVIWIASNFLLKRNPKNYAMHLALIAFAISPALFFTIHLIGFFDNIHYIIALLCIFAILKNTPYSIIIVAIASTIAMFIHEIYLFIALPAVVFSIIYKYISSSAGYKKLLIDLLIVITPCIAALVLLTMVHNNFADENAKNIFVQDFLKNRVVGLYENGSIFYSHFVSFSENMKVMQDIWKTRPAEQIQRGLLIFLPTTILLAVFSINSILRSGFSTIHKLILSIFCFIVIVVPSVMHIIAWDYERIIGFTTFAGFFTLVITGSRRDESTISASAIIISLFIVVLNFCTDFNMYAGYRVRQFPDIVYNLKDEWNKLKLPDNYIAPDSTLFPNSDFELGNLTNWTPSGKAMETQPTYGDNALLRYKYEVPQGDWWIGTVEDNPKKGILSGKLSGDSLKGKLISCNFKIKHNKIAFLIGGGANMETTYVVFFVEGKEIARFAGENDELMKQRILDVSNYINKTAQIEIIDNSPDGWGHINVDDFRYIKD